MRLKVIIFFVTLAFALESSSQITTVGNVGLLSSNCAGKGENGEMAYKPTAGISVCYKKNKHWNFSMGAQFLPKSSHFRITAPVTSNLMFLNVTNFSMEFPISVGFQFEKGIFLKVGGFYNWSLRNTIEGFSLQSSGYYQKDLINSGSTRKQDGDWGPQACFGFQSEFGWGVQMYYSQGYSLYKTDYAISGYWRSFSLNAFYAFPKK